MTDGEHGWGKRSKDDETEFGQEMQLQYNKFELFDYGDAPPLYPYPSRPIEDLAPLQRNVEDDVSDNGNAPVGAGYKGQGDSWGAEPSNVLFFVMLVVLVVDVMVEVDVLVVVVL